MAGDAAIEEGREFKPKFDKNGLIPAIAQDGTSGEILMVAYMNEESLNLTLKTGHVVYFSRSRQTLWKKGEQSGHVQTVQQILVDCDQDCLVIKVSVDSGQCHTGRHSCFYRTVDADNPSNLEFIADKVYDPKKAYRM